MTTASSTASKPMASRQTSKSGGQDEDEDEEGLDPRIQIELEKLNSSTDVINKLELDLEEARATFRSLLSDSGHQLSRSARQLGSCVDRARPYYEARMRSRHALLEAQRAAARYEKASSAHEAAKEMVQLAEEGYIERGMPFDQAWQEMLNHSTTRVNESEIERNLSAEEHRAKSHTYQMAEQRVQDLQRNLKRSIHKSRPYFELKAHLNQTLDDQKARVQLIEKTISIHKQDYSESLRQLEKISEEIHERRQRRQQQQQDVPLGVREAGVGADSPPPSPKHEGNSKLKPVVKDLVKQNSAPVPVSSLAPHYSGECSGDRGEPIGAASATSTSSSTTSQPDPSCIGHQVKEPRISVSSTSTSSRSSSLKSPTYEQLVDSPLMISASSSTTFVGQASPSSPPSGNSEAVTPRKMSATLGDASFEFVTPNRFLQLPNLRRVMDNDDDMSDTDSLASMEMLDDDQIEQLMKEMSLANAANEILADDEDKPAIQDSHSNISVVN